MPGFGIDSTTCVSTDASNLARIEELLTQISSDMWISDGALGDIRYPLHRTLPTLPDLPLTPSSSATRREALTVPQNSLFNVRWCERVAPDQRRVAGQCWGTKTLSIPILWKLRTSLLASVGCRGYEIRVLPSTTIRLLPYCSLGSCDTLKITPGCPSALGRQAAETFPCEVTFNHGPRSVARRRRS